MRKIRKKILKIINHELDTIINRQKNKQNQQYSKSPAFEDFDRKFNEKLMKHDKFMASIQRSFKNTRQ